MVTVASQYQEFMEGSVGRRWFGDVTGQYDEFLVEMSDAGGSVTSLANIRSAWESFPAQVSR